MARARNIKPGFFSNDQLAELKPLVRLLFAGLWTIADRSGRLEDRPNKIKVEVLPYDTCNVDKMLSELVNAGFLQRYTVNGTRYIQVNAFTKHQNPHKNEAPSTIPAPEQHRASTVQSTMQERAKDGITPADSLLLIPDSSNSHRTSSLAVMPEGMDEKVWGAFKAQRKAKRSPLTEIALQGIEREAGKAGISLEATLRMCCERGWQSFKSEWLEKNHANGAKGKFNVHAYTRGQLAETLASEGLDSGST